MQVLAPREILHMAFAADRDERDLDHERCPSHLRAFSSFVRLLLTSRTTESEAVMRRSLYQRSAIRAKIPQRESQEGDLKVQILLFFATNGTRAVIGRKSELTYLQGVLQTPFVESEFI
jgi:hypothetical protein